MSDEKYQNFDKVYSHFYEKNDNVAVLAKNIMKIIKKKAHKRKPRVLSNVYQVCLYLDWVYTEYTCINIYLFFEFVCKSDIYCKGILSVLSLCLSEHKNLIVKGTRHVMNYDIFIFTHVRTVWELLKWFVFRLELSETFRYMVCKCIFLRLLYASERW